MCNKFEFLQYKKKTADKSSTKTTLLKQSSFLLCEMFYVAKLTSPCLSTIFLLTYPFVDLYF